MESSTWPEPLVFRGRLTEADAVALQRCYSRVVLRPWIRWLARGFAATLGSLLTWFMVEKGPEFLAMLVVIFCILVVFVFPFERTLRVRWHYRRHPEVYLESEVRISPEEVFLENDALRLHLKWELIGLVADARNGLLFCNNAIQPLFWLPDRLFVGNELRSRLFCFFADRGIPVRRV